ncbi:prolipoprotein diacylglyceryl transferase [Roseomonas populi]|uniref:Phosphatidylglycerol--prolipoprotein diacylglyceryl transferase n=1 Tax=Roseomonas populi TaxID=3121582 RepID=A0ABT1X921_9PROT|nr:prolipoprotein diacylglyceryl transferase [Roseomonas pecuniae]MCR0984611.1 prolipoprotein diacylglyceryl transferase [Roseomonas pecuniae]
MIPAILFPAFDPVALAVGPFVVRWYALAYIAGIVIGWQVARRLIPKAPAAGTPEAMDDFVTWATLGVILGGRLGYVLFYRPDIILSAPWEILYLWHGGMSFHGGAAGVIIALALFCHRRGVPFLLFSDRVTSVVPVGLGLGRLANFINGELWGRVTDVPWGMIFPHAGPEPRHPSQLYQAALEGLVLFVILQWIVRTPRLRARPGFTAGAFLAGYGVARIIGELFRQPDVQLGFLVGGATMGQLLSVPMVIAGIWLMARSRPVVEAPAA